MNSFEATAFHEAGHATIWFLEEKHLRTPAVISALPDAGSLGRVTPASGQRWDNMNPEAARALGRVFAAGVTAERLAGCPLPKHLEAAQGDIARLARVALHPKRGKPFSDAALVGAEWLLRAHWGAVEGIAELLMRIGALAAPHGIDLARGKLHEKPRPLVPDMKTLSRLFKGIEKVPELAAPIAEELRKMHPTAPPAKARREKPSRRTYMPSTASYIDPVPGIHRTAKARA